MIPFFGNRRATENRAVIERLYEAVVRAARHPALYAGAGVPDTFAGRFEMLVLHAALLLRRLRAIDEPGPSIAQALVDLVFRNLDPMLRELGVGDLAVPKRMKRLAEAFLGRSVAYDAALAATGSAPLEEALRRNVYDGAGSAAGLAAYVRAVSHALDQTQAEALARGLVTFPDPAGFLQHTDPA